MVLNYLPCRRSGLGAWNQLPAYNSRPFPGCLMAGEITTQCLYVPTYKVGIRRAFWEGRMGPFWVKHLHLFS